MSPSSSSQKFMILILCALLFLSFRCTESLQTLTQNCMSQSPTPVPTAPAPTPVSSAMILTHVFVPFSFEYVIVRTMM